MAVRLLKDLLEHEMGVGSLVDVFGRELNFANLEGSVGSGQRRDIELISLDRDNIVVIQINDVPSVGHYRADVAHDKVLTLCRHPKLTGCRAALRVPHPAHRHERARDRTYR